MQNSAFSSDIIYENDTLNTLLEINGKQWAMSWSREIILALRQGKCVEITSKEQCKKQKRFGPFSPQVFTNAKYSCLKSGICFKDLSYDGSTYLRMLSIIRGIIFGYCWK